MNNNTTTTLLLGVVLLMTTPVSNSYANSIEVAMEEMQRANYFTFVMLLRMAPPDLMMILEGGNLTFFMPNDKTLSQDTNIVNLAAPPNHTTTPSSLAHFLLRHSIPSPLLFEYLQHFPAGSTVPTSEPDLVLRITNHGRRSFFLNNVRVSSPDICTRGSSIRCHGIDAVIQPNSVPPPPAAAADHDCRPIPNPKNNNNATSPPPALQPAPREGDGTSSAATSSGVADSRNSAPPSLPGLEKMFEFATKCVALLVLNLIVV
ncbi:FAS1 domain-containing protein SELMODRAFT_448915 [Coffea eugenioides]|uniref:FAS1 domain-containing protein SELMODRAFT_448915 n=1 Tax=Coffea eugenioides TaxID=49369 RepID=UPI000F611F18|nr:FAS1 domain-containing protein SELMODRAFT_448915 [Coffea eugenioides]